MRSSSLIIIDVIHMDPRRSGAGFTPERHNLSVTRASLDQCGGGDFTEEDIKRVAVVFEMDVSVRKTDLRALAASIFA
jgi:hypothetical protein